MSSRRLRFGFVQGRLVQSPGPLQWFPQNQWQEEFSIGQSLGVDYIELIGERQYNPENPLWTDHGVARLVKAARNSGMTLHSLCDDFIIDHTLAGDPAVLEQCLRLISRGKLLGCDKLVLPLLEHSELTLDTVDGYAPALRAIGDAAKGNGMVVCLETILNARDLMEVFVRIGHDNLFAVFDTGNRVAFGHDLPGDIRALRAFVRHVHIKDKNATNENVLLGTGLVDFLAVFKALTDVGYRGPFTFETTRGRDPVRTAKYNMAFVDFFSAEAA